MCEHVYERVCGWEIDGIIGEVIGRVFGRGLCVVFICDGRRARMIYVYLCCIHSWCLRYIHSWGKESANDIRVFVLYSFMAERKCEWYTCDYVILIHGGREENGIHVLMWCLYIIVESPLRTM